MRDQHWKWRMHGGAISLANEFLKSSFQPDLILANDMLNLASFLSLTRNKSKDIPSAIYFHENQLAYPFNSSKNPDRDLHYAFINYSSALCADQVYFNSDYNKSSFLEGLQTLLKIYPDHRNLATIAAIEQKSKVLPLGIALKPFDIYRSSISNQVPHILWNHRWEHDKNPQEFFETLFELKEEGIKFKLIILGERFAKSPRIFDEAKERLKDEMVHFGFASGFDLYARLLFQADIIPVTSNQDFFGISVIEAVYCGVTPLLPRRLAFEELFEGEDVFYDGGDFKAALKKNLALFPFKNKGLEQRASAFDWSQMAQHYDQTFESIQLTA